MDSGFPAPFLIFLLHFSIVLVEYTHNILPHHRQETERSQP